MPRFLDSRAVRSRRRLLLAAVLAGLGPSYALPTDEASAFARNFDNMKLLDQDGRHFSFGALKGKVLLVNFVFTGCSAICPIQTRALAEVQRALPEGLRKGIYFVSVSIDPLSDTPAALKAFALRLGADLSRWSFVTGLPTDLDRLAARLRLFRPGVKQPDDHSTSMWLVDAQGRMVVRLSGSTPDQPRLVRELSALRSM